MTTTLQIQQMSRAEKLRAMEAIWADLSQVDAEVKSPSWHKEALKQTATRVTAGQEQATDWETAKRVLRKRFE